MHFFTLCQSQMKMEEETKQLKIDTPYANHFHPFIECRNLLFGSHHYMIKDANENYMWEKSTWTRVIGKVIKEPVYKTIESSNDGIISFRRQLEEGGKYMIDGKLYDEHQFDTIHPQGSFTFKTYIDEVWVNLPDKFKDMVKSGIILYVCTLPLGRLEVDKDHEGRTIILFPSLLS